MLNTTTLYPINPTKLLHMVNHPLKVVLHVTALESFTAEVREESCGHNHYNMANKDDGQFNFFSSIRPKLVVDCDLEDRLNPSNPTTRIHTRPVRRENTIIVVDYCA